MISIGQSIPKGIPLKKVSEGKTEDITSDKLGEGNIVLFGLPGAFTPVCHTTHLPSFVSTIPLFKEKGIDHVYCIAVNDAFVLQAWAKEFDMGCDITLIADADALLTKALGLDFDASSVGLGVRSLRYAMITHQGIVETLNVELSPSECKVSRAETVLQSL